MAALGLSLGGMAQAEGRPITLHLEFAGDTAATLVGMGEWVTISAFYAGIAVAPEAPLEEDGSVYLGDETLRVFPADQTVTLAGPPQFVPAGWTDEVLINVNVFTARFAAEDNLIDCDFIDGPVAEVALAENTIRCGLIAP
ncbi:MAG: hypothetical protein IT542_13450 [Rubellimicrobium sp.]|nr:hypothetical protein [Rubellimicrobium sp.]